MGKSQCLLTSLASSWFGFPLLSYAIRVSTYPNIFLIHSMYASDRLSSDKNALIDST